MRIRNNEEFDERFELEESVESPAGKKSKKPEKEGNKGKIARTGAKLGKAVVSLALVAGLGVGSYIGAGAYFGFGPLKDFSERGRVNNLVAEYTNDDLFCSLPQETLINKAYDIKYASGEKFVDSLKRNNVKYCEVLDEYYTENGEEIAILTYNIATRDVVPATKVIFGGTVVYMPLEGYTLVGDMCYKEGTEQLIKVVPKSATGDYSNITLDSNLTETATILNASLINVKEVQTKTYDSILDMTLICDVADGAVLDQNNQCTAAFNLVPKSYR